MSFVWPVQLPEHLSGAYAAKLEREGADSGRYPPEWPGVAWLMKTIAGWHCERCGHPHDPDPRHGFVLTVHHLDEDKWNLWSWNLAPLCQRCHLRIQAYVLWDRLWPWSHSSWMARHIQEFNEYAKPRGIPEMPLAGIVERDYSREWPA